MTSPVRPFGDRAFLVEVADLDAARALATAIEHSRRVGTAPAVGAEVLTGFDSVVVRLDPGVAVDHGFEAWLADLASRPDAVPPLTATDTGRRPDGDGRPVDIPVTFDGPDLDAVADAIGATPAAVVDRMTGRPLEVALLGFAPGFPYLVGLPPDLASVPRRPSPRPSVPAGSVAIGGGFASVYPQSSPGGWMVLGRTSTRLFDPDRPPFALVQPGHRVQFSVAGRAGRRPSRVGAAPGRAASSGGRPPLRTGRGRVVEVVEPGLLTLVQDAGRHRVAALGIPRAGPADPESLRLANRLVGNPDGAAGIEVTARGPALRFSHQAHLAVVASAADAVDVHIDGHPARPDVVVPVQPAQTVTIGRVRVGLRAYVAVAGGIETPLVVGSRSSDLLSRLGPGPLVAGDRFGLGAPGRPHGLLTRPTLGPDDGPTSIRVVLGPHGFAAPAADALCSTEWSVAADSNRIGLRLEGGRPVTGGRPAVTSTGMVTGAIQVPPDGYPIVLMVDHATLGGYPVIACVISADLGRLGQLRPGDRLVFSAVSTTLAHRASDRRARALAASVSGWFPTAAAT